MAPRKDATKKPDKAKAAADFEKIINEGRERKRNQELAASIFSSGNRRKSAPTGPKLGGGSLASRVGIKKQRASIGNVGEWTHDLHGTRNKAPAGSLAARISAPGATPAGKAAQKRTARLASGLSRVDPSQVNIRSGPPPTGPKAMRQAEANGARNGRAGGARQQQQQQQQVKQERPSGPEISIRGLAGPYSVLVQNLAPGTTAADIESAMTPVAGEMVDCRILKTQPIMLAEMVFVSREAGEKVIELFNNQKADGRVLKVYPNPSGYTPRPAATENRRPAVAESHVVDGKMGFPEPSTSAAADYSGSPYGSSGAAVGTGSLYSDRLVGAERRGRGFRGDWSRD